MLELIRGVVRPVVTITGFLALTAVVVHQAITAKAGIPDWYQVMVAGIISYWFGQRKPSG